MYTHCLESSNKSRKKWIQTAIAFGKGNLYSERGDHFHLQESTSTKNASGLDQSLVPTREIS